MKMPVSVLDHFQTLSSGSSQTATAAAEQIFKDIPEFGKKNSAASSQCKYVLTRLIRGMAASKPKTKIGFFSALTTLLRQHDGITYQLISEIVESKLKIGNAESNREKYDLTSARLLVCGAIIRSGFLQKCSNEVQKTVVSTIFSTSKIKSYFMPLAQSFIAQLMNEVGFSKTLARILCEAENSEELLCDFWNNFVEKDYESYFANSDGPFNFVSSALELLKEPSMALIFLTPVFIKNLTKDNASSSTKKFSNFFIEFLKNNSENFGKKSIFKKLEILSTDAENPFLESTNGVSFLLSLMQVLKLKKVKQLVSVYKNIVSGTSEKIVGDRIVKCTWSPKSRLNAAAVLLKSIHLKSCQSNIEWQTDQLQFVFSACFCKHFEKVPEDRLLENFKHLFYSSICRPFLPQDYHEILSALANFISNEIQEDNLRITLSEKEKSAWDTVRANSKVIEKKIKKAKSGTDVDCVFLILHLQMGFLLFLQNSAAVEAIEKLNEYSAFYKSKAQKEALSLDTCMNIFLDLLSIESLYVRQVVNKTFSTISSQLKPDCIVRILKILDPSDNDLNEESSSSEQEISDEDDEPEDENSKEESDQSEDDSLSEEDDPDVNKETQTDRMRQAINAALGNNANYTDTESIDADDLDEETGNQLNASIGKVFRLFRKPSKKKKKIQSSEDKAVTHYRIRVLDLIEIIIDGNPSLFAAVNILNTLVMLFEFCKSDKFQEPLKKRISTCLKKVVSLKKFSNFDEVDESYLASTLEALFERHNLLPNPGEYYCFIIRASQQLARVSEVKPDEKTLTVISVLQRAISDFFTKKNSFYKMDMFLPILNLQWDGLHELVPLIASFTDGKDSNKNSKKNSGHKMMEAFKRNKRMSTQLPALNFSPKKKKLNKRP